MRLNLGFYLQSVNDQWCGGVVYYKNLLDSIKSVYGEKIKLYGVVNRGLRKTAHGFKGIVDCTVTIPWTRFYHNAGQEKILNKNKIDIVFGHLLTKPFRKIPTMSSIPDFQHMHLPDFFDNDEIEYRNMIFKQSAGVSSRIILMSDAVKKDFVAYMPQFMDKTRVISLASCIPDFVYETDPGPVLDLYSIPRKFIYMPNQLWRHKNHQALFMAIKILKDRGMKITVIYSGDPNDYRHPKYFNELLSLISVLGIKDEIRYLGMIPYEHVLMLMRQSLCLLNTSLFEGFGLVSSEAKSMGKRIVLSDIPAHREQDPPGALYFNPADTRELADKIAEAWLEYNAGPDPILEAQARSLLPRRIEACAQTFMSVIKEALEKPAK